MNVKSIPLFSAFALVTCSVVSLAAQKKSAGSVLAPDKGRFTINLDGKAIGHEEFEIAPSAAGWVAKGTTSVSLPEGGATKVTGSLTLQSDGAPISYEWTSQADKTNGAHIIFVHGVAKITLEMQGARPFEQDLTFTSPLISVLDNNLYHHYAVIGRIYDWAKGGTQTFPVLIPQELTPGTISVESAGSTSSGGKNYEGLRVTTTDLEILLLFDRSHRLMRLEVPAVKVSVVRD